MILHKACMASRHDFPVSAACCWEGSKVARYFSMWEGPGFSVVKLSRETQKGRRELFQKMTTRKLSVAVREGEKTIEQCLWLD